MPAQQTHATNFDSANMANHNLVQLDLQLPPKNQNQPVTSSYSNGMQPGYLYP